jgi:hypothetical protein
LDSEWILPRSNSFQRSKNYSSKKDSKENSLTSPAATTRENKFFFVLQKKISNDFVLVEKPTMGMSSTLALSSYFNEMLEEAMRKSNNRRIWYRNHREMGPFLFEKVRNRRILRKYLEWKAESEKIGFFVLENRGVDGIRVGIGNKRMGKEMEEREEESGRTSHPRKKFLFNSQKSTE